MTGADVIVSLTSYNRLMRGYYKCDITHFNNMYSNFNLPAIAIKKQNKNTKARSERNMRTVRLGFMVSHNRQ